MKSQTNFLQRLSIYEFVIFLMGIIALYFVIFTTNLAGRVEDPFITRLFMTSVTLLVMLFLGWILYNQTGEQINYSNLDRRYLVPAILIVLGAWAFGYYLAQGLFVSVFKASIASSIDPLKLTQYLRTLAPIFLILFAFVENLFFVVVLPTVLSKIILGKKTIYELSIGEIIVLSIISGLSTVLAHIAWKGPEELVTTFIYFSSWTLATLLIKNSILADIVHAVGNSLGWLQVTINPELFL